MLASTAAAAVEYPVVKGAVFDGDHLQALLDGLQQNGITNYSHLLTG